MANLTIILEIYAKWIWNKNVLYLKNRLIQLKRLTATFPLSKQLQGVDKF